MGDNNNNSRQRKTDKLFNLPDMMKLAMFLIGGGATGAGIVATAPTNAAMDLKVHQVQERVQNHDLLINNCENTLVRQSTRAENYIKAHAEEERLRQEVIDRDIEHIKELLKEIKQDVKDIKNGTH